LKAKRFIVEKKGLVNEFSSCVPSGDVC